MTRKSWTRVGDPVQQGFYEVQIRPESIGPIELEQFVAEWRQRDKKAGKQWWVHVADEPTLEKKPVLLKDTVAGWRRAPKELVEKALARELTREERIARCYERYNQAHRLDGQWANPIAPPPARELKIGMKVANNRGVVGTVVALFEENTLAVVEGEDPGQFQVYHWLRVTPASDNLRTSNFFERSPFNDSFRSAHLEMVMHLVLIQGAIDNMDYQRDYVWELKDKENFIESVLLGRELGRFIFVAPNCSTGAPPQIIDGKQRLNALLEFMASKFPYQGAYWHELSYEDRRMMLNRTVQLLEIEPERVSRKLLLKIFLLANAAGVPQSPEHIARVQALYDAEPGQA